MSSNPPYDPAKLEEQIRLLEAEVALMNERSEDVLLLGLMAENLSPLRSIDSIFEILLERVSILYEIPYSGFASFGSDSCEILYEFVPSTNLALDSRLSVSPEALETLETGALICSGENAAACGVEFEVNGVDPTQIILIPCSSRFEHRGVFIFAHDGPDPEFLPRKLILLQQVIGLATARIDNILLLDELQRMNLELESRVQHRTSDLQRTALALESEIAERKHTEKILAGEQHRLRTVVENLPEGVIVLDAEDRVVLANHAVTRARPLTGTVNVGEKLGPIGDRPLGAFSPDASETTWLEISAESDPPLIYEIAVRSLGSRQGSVVVLRDVSEQRVVAEKLLRQERIAAMGHLAAGVAHDFNNLIQGVTIIAESLLLDEDPDPKSRRSRTREIISLGERSAALIRQILDYSRQTVSRPQLVDLQHFVVETLSMLDRLIPETVRLEFETEPGEHLVHIDPTQLQQVLTNLTLNANQAMPDGGEIRVKLWRTDTDDSSCPDPERVCLSVSDTGCGIPLEAQPRIYEPFFTTKERGRGTGLGLAQTHGIVGQNNGRISFESEVDRGTTFTIDFPAEAAQPSTNDRSTASGSTPQGNMERILVVEDDPTVRELTGEIVATLGYQPVCAADGAEALEVVAGTDEPIHLVLSDVAMPGMGGVELAVELQERNPTIPIVLMSGYAPDPMGGGFSSENLAAWLQKPFSVNALATTLAGILSGEDH